MRRSSLLALRSLLLPIVAGAALAACDETTAPRTPPRPATGVSTLAPEAAGPVVVHPGDRHGWSFVAGDGDTPCDTVRCRFVRGPLTPPLGTGSAELGTSRTAGASLVTDAFSGVRLDHLSALRFSSVGDSAAPNDAVVTLQVRVVLNATDRTGGDAAVLTYQPVPAGSGWEGHDARAGRWWSDHQAPQAVRGVSAHPCVAARPCTWAGLLARFPNAAVAAGGGVRLTVPRGAEWRGHVDSVTVGVDGVDHLFDFELEPPRAAFALTRSVGEGVVVDQWPTDTLFRAGAVVDYAFSAGPGRAAPLVILDDTLAPPAGRIVMNAPHALAVVSDTSYSLATLTPVEARLAQLTRELLGSSDKATAAQNLSQFIVDQVIAGVAPEVLSRAAEVAEYVAVDPVRDSAAIRETEDALASHDFHFDFGGSGRISTWISSEDPASGAQSSSMFARPAVHDLGTASAPPAGSHRALEVIDNENNPRERTKVIYTNGIDTFRGTAFTSATILAKLLYAQPRFANWYTSVILHYNPTSVNEMAEYDRQHPCAFAYVRSTPFTSTLTALAAYASCKHIRFAKLVVANDIVESVRARAEFLHHLAPSTAAVNGLAHLVADLRGSSWNAHVLLVGHSEGTILQAQAVQQLPALERHPLQVANRCVAVLALAPVPSRFEYGLDEHHVMGLLADHDIIRLTLPTGWEDISTPFTQLAGDSILHGFLNPELVVRLGVRIHGVNFTYLTGNVAPVVVARLTTMHRECIPGSAELQASPATVSLGEQVTVSLDVENQNHRPLVGRQLSVWPGYYFDGVDSLTFRAAVPHDQPVKILASITPGLTVESPVTIPLLQPPFAIRDTPLSQWVIVGEANGENGAYSPVGAPTETWDGSPGTCYRHVRIYGDAGNWREYELRCNHAYTPIYARPDSLPSGRPLTGYTVFYTMANGTTTVGPTTYYYCAGAAPCITSGYLEWNAMTGVVARSATATPVIGTSTTTSAAVAAMPAVRDAPRRRPAVTPRGGNRPVRSATVP